MRVMFHLQAGGTFARVAPHADRESVTWLGHATALLGLGGIRLLTDPLLRSRVGHLRRHGSAPRERGAIDAVLVSHLHYDHLDLPSLKMLRPRPRAICPAGAAGLLARAGYEEIDELLPGQSVELGEVHVEATPAEHGSSRRPGGPSAPPLGFVVRGERSVYFAGDTDLFDEMAQLGPVDLALLPVAGYGPKLGEGHLDPRRAAEAAARIEPRVAVPIHWGTFRSLVQPLGPWFTSPPTQFAAQVSELAPAVEVRVLAPGESLEL
jgi:L-ascorbate metabolism protein UlaG (beta-lactamase superfamily)